MSSFIIIFRPYQIFEYDNGTKMKAIIQDNQQTPDAIIEDYHNDTIYSCIFIYCVLCKLKQGQFGKEKAQKESDIPNYVVISTVISYNYSPCVKINELCDYTVNSGIVASISSENPKNSAPRYRINYEIKELTKNTGISAESVPDLKKSQLWDPRIHLFSKALGKKHILYNQNLKWTQFISIFGFQAHLTLDEENKGFVMKEFTSIIQKEIPPKTSLQRWMIEICTIIFSSKKIGLKSFESIRKTLIFDFISKIITMKFLTYNFKKTYKSHSQCLDDIFKGVTGILSIKDIPKMESNEKERQLIFVLSQTDYYKTHPESIKKMIQVVYSIHMIMTKMNNGLHFYVDFNREQTSPTILKKEINYQVLEKYKFIFKTISRSPVTSCYINYHFKYMISTLYNVLESRRSLTMLPIESMSYNELEDIKTFIYSPLSIIPFYMKNQRFTNILNRAFAINCVIITKDDFHKKKVEQDHNLSSITWSDFITILNHNYHIFKQNGTVPEKKMCLNSIISSTLHNCMCCDWTYKIQQSYLKAFFLDTKSYPVCDKPTQKISDTANYFNQINAMLSGKHLFVVDTHLYGFVELSSMLNYVSSFSFAKTKIAAKICFMGDSDHPGASIERDINTLKILKNSKSFNIAFSGITPMLNTMSPLEREFFEKNQLGENMNNREIKNYKEDPMNFPSPYGRIVKSVYNTINEILREKHQVHQQKLFDHFTSCLNKEKGNLPEINMALISEISNPFLISYLKNGIRVAIVDRRPPEIINIVSTEDNKKRKSPDNTSEPLLNTLSNQLLEMSDMKRKESHDMKISAEWIDKEKCFENLCKSIKDLYYSKDNVKYNNLNGYTYINHRSNEISFTAKDTKYTSGEIHEWEPIKENIEIESPIYTCKNNGDYRLYKSFDVILSDIPYVPLHKCSNKGQCDYMIYFASSKTKWNTLFSLLSSTAHKILIVIIDQRETQQPFSGDSIQNENEDPIDIPEELTSQDSLAFYLTENKFYNPNGLTTEILNSIRKSTTVENI